MNEDEIAKSQQYKDGDPCKIAGGRRTSEGNSYYR